MLTQAASPNLLPRAAVAPKERKMFNVAPVAIGWGVLMAIYVGLRFYQQAFAFKYGLDSTTPEFATHWVTLFKLEVPLIFGTGIVMWLYLWMSRDKHMDRLSPETELRRHFNLVAWFIVYTFSFLWVASFYGEGDATWHQTVIRDTALTPSHIVLFYACVPLYIVLGVSTMLYAMTRIPRFADSFSVPLIMAVLGPGLILPNLGYNEWGHAFWLTEEIFSHPLHWGFPILGWTGLALGGVLLQVLMRMAELFKQVDAAMPAAAE
jgi:methane/ammonia monooxygenase subunit C